MEICFYKKFILLYKHTTSYFVYFANNIVIPCGNGAYECTLFQHSGEFMGENVSVYPDLWINVKEKAGEHLYVLKNFLCLIVCNGIM